MKFNSRMVFKSNECKSNKDIENEELEVKYLLKLYCNKFNTIN